MGNFLAISASDSWTQPAQQCFERGLVKAQILKHQLPSNTVTIGWSNAASFPRQNGSGTPIVCDEAAASWLLAIGTWFSTDGLAPGQEADLLQRYLKFDAFHLARQLEGFFCIVVGDGRTKEVVVITDIVGSCHAFIRTLPHAIAISGSSLLLASLDDYSLDATACQEFVSTGIIYQDRTLFKEVRKLSPASVFWFSGGALTKHENYWSCRKLEPESLNGETAIRQLWDSLEQTAKRISRTFPNPVCDLTGGYDSRATVAAFLSVGANVGTTVSGPGDSPDVLVSKGLARLAGLAHTHFADQKPRAFAEVKQALRFTDGEYDLIDYARILSVHRALSNKFSISINGSFGELARGYWWELLVPRTGKPGRLNAAKLARKRYALSSCGPSLFRPDIRLGLVPHFSTVIEQTNADLFATPNTFQMDHAYLQMRMQRWQGRIASSTNQLWPCLSPFMFRSTLQIMLQTRNTLRKRSLMVRHMLAQFQPRLAEFPLEHGYPALPANWRNFYRFRPLLHYYGSKVLQRAGFENVKRQSTQPARLNLWEEDEVRELLNPQAMRTSALLDASNLQHFLEKSRHPGPFPDGEWQRLLSLEYVLRTLGNTV
jgi:hypothetical protein